MPTPPPHPPPIALRRQHPPHPISRNPPGRHHLGDDRLGPVLALGIRNGSQRMGRHHRQRSRPHPRSQPRSSPHRHGPRPPRSRARPHRQRGGRRNRRPHRAP